MNTVTTAPASTTATWAPGEQPEFSRTYRRELGQRSDAPSAAACSAAAAAAARTVLAERWAATQAEDAQQARSGRAAGSCRRVHYLSMEFLMGRSLNNTLYGLDVKDAYVEALRELGYNLEDLMEKARCACVRALCFCGGGGEARRRSFARAPAFCSRAPCFS